MATRPFMKFKSLSTTNLRDSSFNPYTKIQSQSFPQSHALYPDLCKKRGPGFTVDVGADVDLEQKDLSTDNDSLDSDELMICLEPEGLPNEQISSPSYLPPQNMKSIDAICKSLHSSIGLFKSKSKRMKIFKKMILNTTKRDRIAIRLHYYQKYETSLNRVIQRNFHGTFRQLLLFAMMNNEELIVNDIEYALKHKNINHLTTILCTLDNETLRKVHHRFDQSIYHKTKSLQQWTHNITSNIFYTRNINKFLLNILDHKRRNDGSVDLNQVELDTKGLYQQLKHATKQNINKDILIKLFTTRSFQHLSCMAFKYETFYGKSLFNVLKPLFRRSSETGYAILLSLKYAVSRYDVYSTFLAKSIHINHYHHSDGYSSFLRFILLHYDYDLKNIIENYGKSALDSWIKLELRNKGNTNTAEVVMKLCGFI